MTTYDGLFDGVVKLVGVSDDHDLVARCEADVQQQFACRTSQPPGRSRTTWTRRTPTANKGVVVERLSNYFKIPLEQIATIGDQPNDVLMFRRSGLSIAMGNASEEVRRQATLVTASHEDEGFPRRSSGSSCPERSPPARAGPRRVGEAAAGSNYGPGAQ